MRKKLIIHTSSKSDEWETPQGLFDELNCKFSFTLDVCAREYNAKCKKFFTIQDDGLSQDWSKDISFMNPPYGRTIGKWVKKAFEEAQKGGVVVCLLPSRTDTRWWHEYVLKGEIRYLKGRLKMVNRTFPSWRADGNFKISPAPFPSAVVVFGAAA
jgi:phage N-6-adenine-methyltransferase